MNRILTKEATTQTVRRMEVRVARFCGMDADARHALATLARLVGSGRVGVAGCFMPDNGVREHLAKLGVAEHVEEADFFKFRHLVIPFSGISPRVRKAWEQADHYLTDISSPHVRRAQVALGLLRMEGAQALVIGRHDDPESLALAGVCQGTKIIEDTTDTARLPFSPAYGVVCQTTVSPRRVSWLVQQLRMRYRDARVTFLDTTSPAMAAREQALEELLDWCDCVVVVGRQGEASCEALVEAALRKGKPAHTPETPADIDVAALAGTRRLALSAGSFAHDASVRSIVSLLQGHA